jgi:hypothetical protein
MNKICIDCNEEKPIDFFYKQSCHSLGVMSYCKLCFNQRCIDRWRKIKIKALKYLGGRCNDCPLNINTISPVVFDFHHLNPSTKSFVWTKTRLHSWKRITHELDKCIILCANCHRIRHNNEFVAPPGIEPGIKV